MLIFQGTGLPLAADAITRLAADLQVEERTIWALLAVETRGFGFLPDRRPKILFERHVFNAKTQGRFSAQYPDISNPVRGGYAGGAAEYQRLSRAMSLDRTAALESASWGLGQVMGFNATTLGYADADAMVRDFMSGEDTQLAAAGRFIQNNKALHAAVKGRQWKTVAFFYNGSSYADHHYDEKLSAAFDKFQSAIPDITIRGIQAFLTYLGFDPKGVDGVVGSGTGEAIQAFCLKAGISVPTDEKLIADNLRKAFEHIVAPLLAA
jgi:hypothetical protein